MKASSIVKKIYYNYSKFIDILRISIFGLEQRDDSLEIKVGLNNIMNENLFFLSKLILLISS